MRQAFSLSLNHWAGKPSSNIRQTAIEDLMESIGWSALAAEHEFDVA
jgi:hypothetical protein